MKTPAAVCAAAGIARKWEGERRVRHPRVVHTDEPVGVAFRLTTMMYDSGGREANRTVDFRVGRWFHRMAGTGNSASTCRTRARMISTIVPLLIRAVFRVTVNISGVISSLGQYRVKKDWRFFSS